MHLGFQAHPGHAQRLAHAFLVIDHVILGQGMQHPLVRRDRHRLGGIQYPFDIRRVHLAIADRHDAVGIEAADVVAGDADERQWIRQPAICWASSMARWIDCTVDSMFTTTPFFRPRDG